MSVTPTYLLTRAGLAAAIAALALPGAAVAHHKDGHDGGPPAHAKNGKKAKDGEKGKDGKDGNDGKDAPAACDADKKERHPHGGPPGLTKKADEMPECRDADEPAPAAAPAPAPAPAPAAAPVTVVAQSRAALPPCESRRHFRVTLDRSRRSRLQVRKARVTLNGRAISVTKGNKRRRWTALIDLRRRAKGTYTVRTTVVTKRGRIVTGTRRFRTCG